MFCGLDQMDVLMDVLADINDDDDDDGISPLNIPIYLYHFPRGGKRLLHFQPSIK